MVSAFSQDVLQDLEIQGLVGHQALEPGILLLEGREPLGVADDHVPEALLPDIQRAGREAVPAAQILWFGARPVFLEDRDDLFGGESTALHAGLLGRLNMRPVEALPQLPTGGKRGGTVSASDAQPLAAPTRVRLPLIEFAELILGHRSDRRAAMLVGTVERHALGKGSRTRSLDNTLNHYAKPFTDVVFDKRSDPTRSSVDHNGSAGLRGPSVEFTIR